PWPRPGSAGSLAHRRHSLDVGLGRADPHRPLERYDEDLPVADLTRPGPLTEGVDRRLDEGVRDRDLEPDLLREAHLHGCAAVGLDPVELTAVPLYPAHGEPAHLRPIEGLQHVVCRLRADDPDHQLHGAPPNQTIERPRGYRRRGTAFASRPRRRSARPMRRSNPPGAWMLSIRTAESPSLRNPWSAPGGTSTKAPGPARTSSSPKTKVSSPSSM